MNGNNIILPEKYVILDNDTMIMISGGGINIGMTRGYLNKTTCIDTAKGIIRTRGWKKVTSQQLAKEIYGHAAVFYRLSILKKIPKLDKAVYSHCADGVNLDNVTDKYQRYWNIIWNF